MIHKFTDFDIGKYDIKYPIVTLSEESLGKDVLVNSLKGNRRYICSGDDGQKEILSKFDSVLLIMDKVIFKFKQIYPDLMIKHISISGSYLFNKEVSNDIDFNIIVVGSFFSYKDIFDIEEINKVISSPIKKISFMVFGQDDFLYDTGIDDSIETRDFIHTSLIMREGLVFGLRNVMVFGFELNKQLRSEEHTSELQSH